MFMFPLRFCVCVCVIADGDVIRNGRMGSGFLIIRLMELHGCLMIWVGYLCWIIDLVVLLSVHISPRHCQTGVSSRNERFYTEN